MPINIVASQVPRAGTHNVLLNPSLISTCVCACVLGCVQLFATPWTVACQAPLSTEFSRQEHWSGFAFLFYCATWEAPSLPRLIQLVTTYKSYLPPASLEPIAPASGIAPPAWLLTDCSHSRGFASLTSINPSH